ncbi:MAG: Gfo/Idh/MocA family oxidoreductase [Bacteroidaceae bacterium]|nr:Gfo/Idh/MocA family oxidoreductase [Bacteroidaceae bacterium]
MTVSIELIGLGDRGLTNLRLMLRLAQHVPLCFEVLRDNDPARVEAARALCRQAGVAMGHPEQPCGASGGSINSGNSSGGSINNGNSDSSSGVVRLTMVCTDWQSHAPLAIDAMRRGRHVAVEVPAALTLADIRALVATSAATGRHCFMLENCCYDPAILDAISRIRRGEIGDIVHAEGTYYHSLGNRWTPWRLEMNRRQRGDLYPTHELAPLCMALGISPAPVPGAFSAGSPAPVPGVFSAGSPAPVPGASSAGSPDRLSTLVSMDSAPFSGPAIYERHLRRPAPDFRNGDHTTTLIRTQRGRTILLRHDVLTPHTYERLFHIVGTRGTITVTDDGTQPHDHITLAMHESLLTALANGRCPDFSVHDLAAWCAVTPLSAMSIERGFAPVAFPDDL